jgi:hypothetical protein
MRGYAAWMNFLLMYLDLLRRMRTQDIFLISIVINQSIQEA